MTDRDLSRGKRLDNRGWEVGFYVSVAHIYDDTHRHDLIFPLDRCVDCEVEGDKRMFEVDPATVGRCTGLRDKNGKLFFEGDIVHFAGVLELGVVVWNKKNCCFSAMRGNCECYLRKTQEIIGNIHDNPELLKEGLREGLQEAAQYATP